MSIKSPFRGVGFATLITLIRSFHQMHYSRMSFQIRRWRKCFITNMTRKSSIVQMFSSYVSFQTIFVVIIFAAKSALIFTGRDRISVSVYGRQGRRHNFWHIFLTLVFLGKMTIVLSWAVKKEEINVCLRATIFNMG